MASESGPQHLSRALGELIALRGYARVQGNAQLQEAWAAAAGLQFARQTRAVAIRRGVLHVAVANAPLLCELSSFHREALLGRLAAGRPEMKIKDLKFKLDSNISNPGQRSRQ
jgi:predicted nucleic acid-binding Zn ribbon protein